jgi:1-acyl-sn-glycerol-3-phosphate acyltransferase
LFTHSSASTQRRLPVFFSQIWGILVLRLSRSYPEVIGREKLQTFYRQNRPAMFVANHCSWMDIPFVGATVGWRNYKLVSKKELGIVPILGDAIRVGGNIMVDRTDRKSQLKTLKQGINYLKNVRTSECE